MGGMRRTGVLGATLVLACSVFSPVSHAGAQVSRSLVAHQDDYTVTIKNTGTAPIGATVFYKYRKDPSYWIAGKTLISPKNQVDLSMNSCKEIEQYWIDFFDEQGRYLSSHPKDKPIKPGEIADQAPCADTWTYPPPASAAPTPPAGR